MPRCKTKTLGARSSSSEVRIRVPDLFSVVCFRRGTLPQKVGKRALLGDLEGKHQARNVQKASEA